MFYDRYICTISLSSASTIVLLMNYFSWIFVHQLLSDFIHFSVFCFPISVSMEKYASDAFDSMETDDCLFLLTQLIKSNSFWAAHCPGGELKRPSLNETSFSSWSLLVHLTQCWHGCFSIFHFLDYLKKLDVVMSLVKLQNPGTISGTISSISSFSSNFTLNIKLKPKKIKLNIL